VVYFKPAGVPLYALEEVILTLDEVEALRLADLRGLYQEQSARRMRISRATFARIVEAARRKTADVLVHGKALRVEGGSVMPDNEQPQTSSHAKLGDWPKQRRGRDRQNRTK
jgi:predicted DNA-binding protein (UPF0251 family)